jgi:hypothetical protein
MLTNRWPVHVRTYVRVFRAGRERLGRELWEGKGEGKGKGGEGRGEGPEYPMRALVRPAKPALQPLGLARPWQHRELPVREALDVVFKLLLKGRQHFRPTP